MGDRVAIVRHTHSTNTLLSTQTSTAMATTVLSTFEELLAGPVTSWAIAQFTTQLATLEMKAFPLALFSARLASLPTLEITFRMHATVFARNRARRARACAPRPADMRADQYTATLQFAALMNSTHATLATLPGARVTTFQSGTTKDWAICRSCRASNLNFMTTRPIFSLDKLLAFSCARLTTVALTAVETG